MTLYVANRSLDIVATIPGRAITSDLTEIDASTGRSSLTAVIHYGEGDWAMVEALAPGNFVLKRGRDGCGVAYTIMDASQELAARVVEIYCEDVGLDLINDVAAAYEATEAMGAADYINPLISGSGFAIRLDETEGRVQKLSWDGENSVANRIASVANSFDADLHFCVEIEGFRIAARYIDLLLRREKVPVGTLRLGSEVKEIRIIESATELATALSASGQNGLRLTGQEYDDGDIYYDEQLDLLRSREARKKWRRWAGDTEKDIVRTYEANTASPSKLLTLAVARLKAVKDISATYEAEVERWPDDIRAGDCVTISDGATGFALNVQVQIVKSSETTGRVRATFREVGRMTDSDRFAAWKAKSERVDGEDAVNIYIHSSRGMAFKNNEVDTLLTVTVYYGRMAITSKSQLIKAFGSGAYLQWQVRTYGADDFSTLPMSDPRISNDGFALRISPDDVDTQCVFNVQVVTAD